MIGWRFRLGLTGWVRNRGDGSVEELICGEPAAVEALLDWARHGPAFAKVDEVIASDAEGEFDSFAIQLSD